MNEANKSHFIAHAKEMIRLMDTHEQKTNSLALSEFLVNKE
jgi:hypothetical protein